MTIPKKCHNCKAGQVDGGFAKRVKRQMKELENRENAEMNGLKGIKDKEKRKKAERDIKNKYYKLMQKKSNETPKFISNCGYCGGEGYS